MKRPRPHSSQILQSSIGGQGRLGDGGPYLRRSSLAALWNSKVRQGLPTAHCQAAGTFQARADICQADRAPRGSVSLSLKAVTRQNNDLAARGTSSLLRVQRYCGSVQLRVLVLAAALEP